MLRSSPSHGPGSLVVFDPRPQHLPTFAATSGEIRSAADLRAPHRLARYAEDAAALFHRFYAECRVVGEQAGLTQARLWLCRGAKQVVAGVLSLLGVSAPESMERIDE